MRLLNRYSQNIPHVQKKVKETLCLRNILVVKISPQSTFMYKEGINKIMSVNKNLLLKRKEILGI